MQGSDNAGKPQTAQDSAELAEFVSVPCSLLPELPVKLQLH